jgi:hypothetical protein
MDTNKYKKELQKEKDNLTKLISNMQDNTLFGNTQNTTSERYSSGELSSYEVSLDSRVFIFVSNDDYKGLLRMIVDKSLVYNIDGEMSYKHNLEYFT